MGEIVEALDVSQGSGRIISVPGGGGWYLGAAIVASTSRSTLKLGLTIVLLGPADELPWMVS